MRAWKWWSLGAMILAGCAAAPVTTPKAGTPAAATKPADGYQLVWADEFNVDGPLNSKDWGYETGFVRNHEAQWYQAEKAVCKGGKLIIEARKETKPNPGYVAGSNDWRSSRKTIDYTSASVNTRGKHSWLYGRFEIRAKIDTHAGSWPAFWTLGINGRWPANGEIDIMEYYRDMVRANIAWARAPNGPEWNSSRKPLPELGKDWSSTFHIWRMDWDENSIKLYCDGVQMNSQDTTKTINPDGVNPFHGTQYLLLNQAIGGDNGGDPGKTSFPLRYEIDYVRVYQKPAAATRP